MPDVRFYVEEMILRLKSELEQTMRLAAQQAAAREHKRTREWLENRGLPKVARVAQHEAYNVLRKYGAISESVRTAKTLSELGRSSHEPKPPQPLSSGDIHELAQSCIALLESQGQSIERTLSEMSVEAGGFLLPCDAAKVREKAESLLRTDGERAGAREALDCHERSSKRPTIHDWS
jgi:hypothetical protein